MQPNWVWNIAEFKYTSYVKRQAGSAATSAEPELNISDRA